MQTSFRMSNSSLLKVLIMRHLSITLELVQYLDLFINTFQTKLPQHYSNTSPLKSPANYAFLKKIYAFLKNICISTKTFKPE